MQNLTIIILTFNSENIIKNCLENINFEKYRVIIVDNASSDKTVEIVKNNFSKTEIIELPTNIGYGNGNNIALEKVETEFVLILNPDAIIDDKNIEIVLSEMKKNPLVAMAGPIVLDNYPLQQSEIDVKISHIKNDLATIKDCYRSQIDDNYSARFLIGAALFMKMELMKKIGFFDKNIFLYYEDDELCFRVEKNGYLNLIVPTAFAFHINGGGKSSTINHKIIYKKNWHLTWSKLYWKKLRKGVLRAKRSATKFVIVYFLKSLFFAIKIDKQNFISYLAKMSGAFCFLIGLTAFKKNNISRG